MEHAYILNNGVSIPAIGLGTWKTPDGKTAVETVKYAIQSGYRHIDCAAAYGNEVSVGEGIRLSGVPRHDLFVTSKLWTTDRGYDSTIRAFGKTLTDLRLDYLDLYLIHWPASASRFSDWQEINRQTWRAMEKLYADGRVRAIGVSNFMPHHLEALLSTASVVPAVNQIEFHPGFTQPKCVAFCHAHDILVEAWSPLGRGRLADNPLLHELADRYGKSVAQICLRWELQRGALPLPKSVTPQRLIDNLDVWNFTLSDADMARIDAMPITGESGLDPDTVDF